MRCCARVPSQPAHKIAFSLSSNCEHPTLLLPVLPQPARRNCALIAVSANWKGILGLGMQARKFSFVSCTHVCQVGCHSYSQQCQCRGASVACRTCLAMRLQKHFKNPLHSGLLHQICGAAVAAVGSAQPLPGAMPPERHKTLRRMSAQMSVLLCMLLCRRAACP